MPGVLAHSQADIIRYLLIQLGLGGNPLTSPLPAWPIYAADEPDVPDNCITVYDTPGIKHCRVMPGGEVQEHHGFQVRIRATSHPVGRTKADAIKITIDQVVYQNLITVGSTSYRVHCLNRTTDVLSLGREVPLARRSLFTVNGLASLRQVP